MDLLAALEDEHGPLAARVQGLGELVAAITEGARAPESAHAEFVAGLEVLRDELLDHFGREEECFFPFFAEALPDAAPAVHGLEAAHDRICGALTRLVHLSARSEAAFAQSFVHVARVYARFAATYAEHAESEREVLHQAAERLSDEQRGALEEAARGL